MQTGASHSHEEATEPRATDQEATEPRATDQGATEPRATDQGATEREAIEQARRLFLDRHHLHGCAETAFVVLKTVYGLDDPADSSAAMALNGGVAYGGGPCGAISGAALAVGLLAGRRIADHRQAKLVARELIAGLMDDFREAYASVDCRDLIGIDLRAPGAHTAFLRSLVWRDRCMPQIEFAITRLAPLADQATWDSAVTRLAGSGDR
jgi:C_GCAxxG_C_C family probable redox protein